eukprot:6208677-Pleurochrysis_carterae.AAC.9
MSTSAFTRNVARRRRGHACIRCKVAWVYAHSRMHSPARKCLRTSIQEIRLCGTAHAPRPRTSTTSVAMACSRKWCGTVPAPMPRQRAVAGVGLTKRDVCMRAIPANAGCGRAHAAVCSAPRTVESNRSTRSDSLSTTRTCRAIGD